MCGITAIFNFQGTYLQARKLAVKLSRRLKHRGPDDSGIWIHKNSKGLWNIICHERLSIVDLAERANQPYYCEEEEFAYALKEKYGKDINFLSNCDTECFTALYSLYRDPVTMFNLIEGMWGIVLYDVRKELFICGRDHLGIIPLYIGIGVKGETYVSSELKAIHDYCYFIDKVNPGCFTINGLKQNYWYTPKWKEIEYIPENKCDLMELRQRLTEAVKTHLMGDVPFGLLISGGVDSSIIASITMRLIKNGEIDIKKKGMTEVPSFCIGVQGSPDLKNARKVADFLGTKHFDFHFTPNQGIDAIPEVIYYTETFNPTTIRASTPMFLLARKIRQYCIKMVMTGEGADEIFGGYLYFHKAPNRKEFHQELVRKLDTLHLYDLLRANKSTMAWGLEVRPPFVDKSFLEYAMSIDPEDKMTKNNPLGIGFFFNFNNAEKYILRKAFDDEEDPYLPKEILWRQKEQFSDGVGYDWIDQLRDLSEQSISEEFFSLRDRVFPFQVPMSKEMMMFRQIFEKYFPEQNSVRTVPYGKSIACSTEKAIEWDESFKLNADESGRAVLGVHEKGVAIEKLENK